MKFPLSLPLVVMAIVFGALAGTVFTGPSPSIEKVAYAILILGLACLIYPTMKKDLEENEEEILYGAI